MAREPLLDEKFDTVEALASQLVDEGLHAIINLSALALRLFVQETDFKRQAHRMAIQAVLNEMHVEWDFLDGNDLKPSGETSRTIQLNSERFC